MANGCLTANVMINRTLAHLSAAAAAKDDNESLLDLVRHYLEASPSSQSSAGVASGDNEAVIRFRPPYTQTSKYDARGDAIALVVEHLQQRKFPLWAAFTIAYSLVDMYADKLHTAEAVFDDDDYGAIDASVWCRDVIQHLDVYLDKLANESVPLPKCLVNPTERMRYSYCAQKNRRPKMEDRATILPSLSLIEPTKNGESRKRDAFFAIFDGHNGVECACYASAHFARCLIENPGYSTGKSEDLMRTTFDVLDRRLTARCKHEHIKSGTTAVCAFVRAGKQLCIGWCGDSAIAVLRRNGIRKLSTVHSPKVSEEKYRVEQAGGVIIEIHGEPRVNGILNITRSLGDIDCRPMISQEPDVLSFELDNTDYVLLLACDGVWDSFTEQTLFSHITDFVNQKSPAEYADMAEYIVDRAKETGQTDNLSLICVFLRPVQDLWEMFRMKEAYQLR